MAQLVLRTAPDAVSRWPLGERATLGRGEDNTIALSDPTLARHHLVFERRGAGHTVRDLGSPSGCYVNRERLVGERLLTEGDMLRVGRLELQYQSSAGAPRR